jgi:hypothetical protein
LPADWISVAQRLARDLAYLLAVSIQYPDLQRYLPSNPPAPSDCQRASLEGGSDFSRRPGSELQPPKAVSLSPRVDLRAPVGAIPSQRWILFQR